jgi:hypothetical protein
MPGKFWSGQISKWPPPALYVEFVTNTWHPPSRPPMLLACSMCSMHTARSHIEEIEGVRSAPRAQSDPFAHMTSSIA